MNAKLLSSTNNKITDIFEISKCARRNSKNSGSLYLQTQVFVVQKILQGGIQVF